MIDLNCDELPKANNGQFKVSGDYFGARVTYTCDDGFYMSGPRERVCQGDGSWSDQPPDCKKEGTINPWVFRKDSSIHMEINSSSFNRFHIFTSFDNKKKKIPNFFNLM